MEETSARLLDKALGIESKAMSDGSNISGGNVRVERPNCLSMFNPVSSGILGQIGT